MKKRTPRKIKKAQTKTGNLLAEADTLYKRVMRQYMGMASGPVYNRIPWAFDDAPSHVEYSPAAHALVHYCYAATHVAALEAGLPDCIAAYEKAHAVVITAQVAEDIHSSTYLDAVAHCGRTADALRYEYMGYEDWKQTAANYKATLLEHLEPEVLDVAVTLYTDSPPKWAWEGNLNNRLQTAEEKLAMARLAVGD